MPRDFKSFSKETQKNEEILKNNQENAKKYEEIINKYKNMSSNDLMNSLISEATKLKSEGKLDASSLSSLKSSLSPFLNQEQQEMLDNLIAIINEQK